MLSIGNLKTKVLINLLKFQNSTLQNLKPSGRCIYKNNFSLTIFKIFIKIEIKTFFSIFTYKLYNLYLKI